MNAIVVALPDEGMKAEKTSHSRKRMSQRGVRQKDVDAVLKFGRIIRKSGAHRYFLGRKEVKRWAEKGVDLRKFENLHVVMDSEETKVLTVYRNASARERSN